MNAMGKIFICRTCLSRVVVLPRPLDPRFFVLCVVCRCELEDDSEDS